MSGFLRRTKRSRAADTGETSAKELGAGPEGARTAESPAVDASNAKTTELPAGVAVADASGPVMPTTPSSAAGSDTVGTSSGLTGANAVGAARAAGAGPARPQAVAGPAAAEAAGPVVEAARDTPAGLDPAEAGAKVATGRRGRLRRRLRYLRRARELMLRDLGGLLYEVHRTGGGDVTAHTATIGGKIERLAALDGEAAAIETALGASRGPAVVFEPGIGGTCEICGELYGSAARFCSQLRVAGRRDGQGTGAVRGAASGARDAEGAYAGCGSGLRPYNSGRRASRRRRHAGRGRRQGVARRPAERARGARALGR